MKNRTTLLILTFAAGAIIGAAIVWMLCICCCKTSCCSHQTSFIGDTTGIRKISVPTANSFFKNYLESPTSVDTLIAFTINAEQYNSMVMIAKSDPTVHGFRIYMGIDSVKTPVMMVVGTGSGDKGNPVYGTSSLNSGPCPRVCDRTSPIVK
jgi:hypothetical protein